MKSFNLILSSLNFFLFLCLFCNHAYSLSFSFKEKLIFSKNNQLTLTKAELPYQSKEIQEPASKIFLDKIFLAPVTCPQDISPKPIYSSFAYYASTMSNSDKVETKSLFDIFKSPTLVSKKKLDPIVLLHGFDSSSLEFRRLAPLLNIERDVYAVDLLGY